MFQTIEVGPVRDLQFKTDHGLTFIAEKGIVRELRVEHETVDSRIGWGMHRTMSLGSRIYLTMEVFGTELEMQSLVKALITAGKDSCVRTILFKGRR